MPRWHVVWWCVTLLAATSCIVGDDKCGAHQHYIKNGGDEGCVCDSGAVPDMDNVGCHTCGNHEVVKAGMCVCETDYARANAAAECTPKEDMPMAGAGSTNEPKTKGQGMMCSATSDCAGTDATYCLTLQPPAQCYVEKCADGTNRCASDRECCVISVLPELAATGGLCVPKDTCMAPGMVVTP